MRITSKFQFFLLAVLALGGGYITSFAFAPYESEVAFLVGVGIFCLGFYWQFPRKKSSLKGKAESHSQPTSQTTPQLSSQTTSQSFTQNSLLLAYLWDFSFSFSSLIWLIESVEVYGQIPAVASYLMMTIIAAIIAVRGLLVAWIFRRVSKLSWVGKDDREDKKDREGSTWAKFFLLPLIFTVTSWLYHGVLLNFDWLNLGYTSINQLSQAWAPIGGVYLVEFVKFSIVGFVVLLVVKLVQMLKTSLSAKKQTSSSQAHTSQEASTLTAPDTDAQAISVSTSVLASKSNEFTESTESTESTNSTKSTSSTSKANSKNCNCLLNPNLLVLGGISLVGIGFSFSNIQYTYTDNIEHKVAFVQPNIAPGANWDPNSIQEQINLYYNQLQWLNVEAQQDPKKKVDLVILPESAIGVLWGPNIQQVYTRFAEIVGEQGASLLTGSFYEHYNSVMLIQKQPIRPEDFPEDSLTNPEKISSANLATNEDGNVENPENAENTENSKNTENTENAENAENSKNTENSNNSNNSANSESSVNSEDSANSEKLEDESDNLPTYPNFLGYGAEPKVLDLNNGYQAQLSYKRHLVPFGEYLPMAWLLRDLMPFFQQLDAYRIYSGDSVQANLDLYPKSWYQQEGKEEETNKAKLKSSDASDDITRIIAAICYDVLFGSEMAANFNPDTGVIVSISNDVWFGNSAGPFQHWNIVRLRALESQRQVLRGSNNGITGVIDTDGQVLSVLPRNVQDNLVASWYNYYGQTPYQSYPYLNLVLGLVFAGVSYGLSRRTARKPKTTP